jgi:hypothetical protein
VVGVPCALVGAGIGRFIARRAGESVQKRFSLYGAVLPICAGIYLLGVIVVMAAFGLATDRDFGFGDGFDIPLSNGYHWSATDLTEVATISNKYSVVFENVLSLQQHGDWLAGSYLSTLDRMKFDMAWKPDHWFLFNTKTQERLNASDEAGLANIAKAHQFALELEPSADFYAHYRYHWYDAAFAIFLFIPGLILLVCCWKRGKQLLQADTYASGGGSGGRRFRRWGFGRRWGVGVRGYGRWLVARRGR